MVKYSAKKRVGSKKQSFKKRKYNKKKGGGDDGDEKNEDAAVDAPTTDAPAPTTDGTPTDGHDTTTSANTDDPDHLKKFYDDLIERILGQINNICDEKDQGKRKEMLENAIMGKTE